MDYSAEQRAIIVKRQARRRAWFREARIRSWSDWVSFQAIADAVDALLGLHDADNTKLKRRVYNIAGIRMGGKPPAAGGIAAAVKEVVPKAAITFKSTPLEATVRGFGVLDDTAAGDGWGWPRKPRDLATSVKLFVDEARNYPDRIKALELFGA